LEDYLDLQTSGIGRIPGTKPTVIRNLSPFVVVNKLTIITKPVQNRNEEAI
jgi:hypothetical protein